MNELELLLIRLEDYSESAEEKEVRVLARALKRYFNSLAKDKIGFKNEV